ENLDTDVVMSDINMPGMDGLSLTAKILENGIRTEVIIVSAYSDMGNIRKAMNLGAFDFITKPIDLEDLEKTLYKTLLHHAQGVKEENVELETALRELKETQQQLLLKEKMASLGKLVAGIAHEINTPIGVITSSIDTIGRCIEKLAKTMNSGAAQSEQNETIVKLFKLLNQNAGLSKSAGDRVSGIVASLKNFSRLDQEEYQSANLNESIEDILRLLSGRMEHITLKMDLAPLPKIMCAPGQLNQVFMSILVNAIQAIPETGLIYIESRDLGEKLEMRIRDTGVGMPPEVVKSAFDFRFTKIGARVKMGIGLASSYSIIQKHDGNMAIDSKPGEGTEVRIQLPVKTTNS
ncbi:MAG: response regulator, partial [Calditrichota bacterium]